MSQLTGRFAPNRDDVVSKIIDGELIIIRLSDGTYYSMDGVGARAWALIEEERDLPAVATAIAAEYDVPPSTAERDLDALITSLRNEGLIAPAEGAPAPAAADGAAPATRLSYETPRLNVYRDMGNLLALDPPTPGIDDLPFKGGKYK